PAASPRSRWGSWPCWRFCRRHTQAARSEREHEQLSPDAEPYAVCTIGDHLIQGGVARTASIERNTQETQIRLALDLDGGAEHARAAIPPPVPFLSHMLHAFARHGVFGLSIEAAGDVEIDAHHTVEDVGLVLGTAFEQALGDRAGIVRYGSATLPMDDVLVT